MNLRRTKIGLLVGLATLAGATLPADAAKLQQIKVNPSMAGQVAIEFQFDGQVPSYTDVLKYRPNYLLVNIADSENAMNQDSVKIDRGSVKDVNLVNSGNNLQLKVGLNDLVPYKISQNGNSLTVNLGQNGNTIAARANAGSTNSGSINTINNVDFRKNGSDGLLVVSLDNNSAAVDVSPRGSSIQLRFNATDVNADQLQSYDVMDFGTVVKNVSVNKKNGMAVVDIACNGLVDYHYEQKGNNFEISIAKKKVAKQELPKYNGKPISLNFQDVPVRTVLQLIADFNNFNLVTTDTVKGNITIRLDSVPWEQALDTILQVKGLDKRLDGNILLVAQAKELADLEQQKLEGKKKVEDLAPLVNEYIQINYAKASDIAALLGVASSGSAEGSNSSTKSIISPRGSVSVDVRTNTLIVKDTDESIQKILDLVKKLDIPVKQVSIEARIVTVDEEVTDELGVNWSFSKTKNNTPQNVIPAASSTILDPYGAEAASDSGSGAKTWSGGRSGHGHFMSQTAFNTATQGFGVSIGKIWDNVLVDMYLSALESETKAEVIASPRVTTANQKEAIIEQGTKFPTEVSTSSGATSVEWETATLSLKVTPQITPDNRIILDLTVTQDTLGETVSTGTGRAQSINTQSVTTQVLVENGETIVLGGIYQQTINKNVTKVPLLGDIPFLGALFRYTKDQNIKRELLIFVTPKIVVDKR